MAHVDRNGQALFAGDRVIAHGTQRAAQTFIVRGRVRLVGSRVEQLIIRAQLKTMGYSLDEIVDLVGLGWYPCKLLERVGTTFEAAEKSFNEMMRAVTQ